MAINPRVAARREAEIAFLKEEDDRLKDLGEKRKKEAAERSAAGEKRYVAPKDAARQKISDSVAEKAGVSDDVFEKIEKDVFKSRKRTEESESNFVEDFGKELKKILNDTSDYIIEKQAQGKIVSPQKGYGSRNEWYQQSDDDYKERHEAAEEYAMSEGKNAFENTVKGMFNRFRSAPGEAIEDAAYFLNDTIPEDAPVKAMRGLRENAGNVAEKNMAGSIGDQATEHFNLARENAGAVGNKLIDVFDAASTMMGYGMAFGPSHLALSQSIGEGLDEYRYQRETGANKLEALTRGGLKGIASYLIERLGGLGADNSAAPKVDFLDVVSVTDAILKTAAQEGGEGFAEYTVDSFINTLADAVFKGKLSVNWNIEEALDYASTDMMVGGLLSTSSVVNGRDIDIVDEMNKILTDSKDTNTRISNTEDLKKYLLNKPKARKELNKLLWALKDKKTGEVKNTTRNTLNKPVIVVNETNPWGYPNLITQVERKNGGILRNYYDDNGKQFVQVVNFNEDGDNKNLPKDKQSEEHTHDYIWDGKHFIRPKRRLNDRERKENSDIL